MDENPAPSAEEALRQQLLANSISSEISRVMASATELERVYSALVLGLQEMMGFRRVALLGLQPNQVCLAPLLTAGVNVESFQASRFGLGFMDGEYADAIFRNRHMIVDQVPDFDAFHSLGCRSYAVFPVMARMRPLDISQSHQQVNCPFQREREVFCWNFEAGVEVPRGMSEDERRRTCIQCPRMQCMGLIWLDLTDRTMITGEEVGMLTSIAAQAGMVMENFALYESMRRANETLAATNQALEEAHRLIQRDMRQANAVQKKLLPTHFPASVPDVAAHYVPHSAVGGDYFDCFDAGQGRFGLLVADVSGHGVSAALVMSMFKMMLKSRIDLLESPSKALETINATFLRELDADKFVTCFLGIFDPATRTLLYTSAGHDPMLLLDLETNELRELKSRGRFVGVLEDIGLSDVSLVLEKPCRLLLYTDGITEAMDSDGKQFGLDRLKRLFRAHASKPSKELVKELIADLDIYTGAVPLHDDITLLSVTL